MRSLSPALCALLVAFLLPVVALGQGGALVQKPITSGDCLMGVPGTNSVVNTIADAGAPCLTTAGAQTLVAGNTAPSWTASRSGTPFYLLKDTTQGTDAKNWVLDAFSGGFALQTQNDAGSATNTAFTCARSGYTVSSCQFDALLSEQSGNATTAQDWFKLLPSDQGAGKPGFYIAKSATANIWQINLYDASDGLAGELDMNLSTFEVTVGGVTIAQVSSTGAAVTGQVTATTSVAATTSVTGGTYIKHGVTQVALLPTCNSTNAGMEYGVSDSNTVTFHTTVGGGSSNPVKVYCNGTNWVVGG